MIKFGFRRLEQGKIIIREDEQEKVSKWFKKTGFVPIDTKPVPNIVLHQFTPT